MLGEKLKLLILSNFIFLPQYFHKDFFFTVLKWVYMEEKKLIRDPQKSILTNKE